MRAVIYARYSSDSQSAASIDDQLCLCKERVAREGWTLQQVYRDAAMSGASSLRPGYQALLQAARQAECDVIVVMSPAATSDQLRSSLVRMSRSKRP